MTDSPDDLDLLAAEYVLGVLDLRERVEVDRRLRDEPGLVAAVAAWEERLSGLNDDIVPLPAPDLLPRIEARLFGTPAARPGFFARWRQAALAGAALVALTVAVVLMQPRAPEPVLVATLAAEAQSLRFEVRRAGNALTVTRVAGPEAAAGSTYQLWLIAGDAAPVPLGLLAGETVTAEAALAAGVVLAVSLEPAGGSPTGLPTGPVLVTGEVADL